AKGDILVLDEVLAVGDEAFQRKCATFFEQIKKDKTKTVILVTHTMENVRKYCNKAIMLDQGTVSVIGDPEEIANEYSLQNALVGAGGSEGTIRNSDVVSDIQVKLLSPEQISEKEKVKVRVSYYLNKSVSSKILLNLLDMDRQVPLYSSSS